MVKSLIRLWAIRGGAFHHHIRINLQFLHHLKKDLLPWALPGCNPDLTTFVFTATRLFGSFNEPKKHSASISVFSVYPGLMVTAGLIHWILNMLNITVHIRDVCVFLAPVFSGLTSISTFLLTRELWNQGAGLLAACFIAIVPGYISRSVAGSFDNEGIAIFALQFTYYLWVSSLIHFKYCLYYFRNIKIFVDIWFDLSLGEVCENWISLLDDMLLPVLFLHGK
ncbi:hypothetical protein JD844_002851 [Phrynosoma platyrhinos]|uniref:dolichyl-diphosphooligosaccharide--protein glycotransferase n=1 Tax=Phrynosoma platyrhinos TaxID=52577 RepID=A0ABQ7TCE2_PHRPL|nr:hypothetical protein JD844_002851 [Phrynosoma platyrhinos]